MPVNIQPVFSYTPSLIADVSNAPVTSDNVNTGLNSEQIYSPSGDNQAIVNKITLSATGDLTYSNVLDKLVYVYLIHSGSETGSLYYNTVMPATTITDTTANPVITFEPTGGLLLKKFDYISIAVSQNSSRADYIAYTIEASEF